MKKKFDKVYIEITNVCNLNCSFCDKTTRKSRFMTCQEFEQIIHKIKPYTNLIALHIKGEPLLHPTLKEILRIAEENKILVNLTTNTTLLDKNMDILAKSNSLRQMNLSMHSFMQNGLEIKKNVESTIDIVREIQGVNPKVIISYRLWNINALDENDCNNEIIKIIGERYGLREILERSQREKFIKLGNNVYLNQDIEFEWPSLKKEIVNQYGKCYGLKKQLGILVNGDVVPCCLDQNGDIVLGNIFSQSLDEILNSSRAQKIFNGFNNGVLEEELCKRCGFINTRLNKN